MKVRVVLSRREILKAGLVLGAGASCLPSIASAATPTWIDVPDQEWTVGVPVYLDLASYATDLDGHVLTFSLDAPLPAGVTLLGSVISGTPSVEFEGTFVATADDTPDVVAPAPPTNLRVF